MPVVVSDGSICVLLSVWGYSRRCFDHCVFSDGWLWVLWMCVRRIIIHWFQLDVPVLYQFFQWVLCLTTDQSRGPPSKQWLRVWRKCKKLCMLNYTLCYIQNTLEPLGGVSQIHFRSCEFLQGATCSTVVYRWSRKGALCSWFVLLVYARKREEVQKQKNKQTKKTKVEVAEPEKSEGGRWQESRRQSEWLEMRERD